MSPTATRFRSFLREKRQDWVGDWFVIFPSKSNRRMPKKLPGFGECGPIPRVFFFVKKETKYRVHFLLCRQLCPERGLADLSYRTKIEVVMMLKIIERERALSLSFCLDHAARHCSNWRHVSLLRCSRTYVAVACGSLPSSIVTCMPVPLLAKRAEVARESRYSRSSMSPARFADHRTQLFY